MEGLENQNQEIKISQEVIEEMEKAAMEKVEDLNAFGTAFHVLTPNGIKSIETDEEQEKLKKQQIEQLKRTLDEGILSGTSNWEPIKDIKEWKERVKKRLSAAYFNIVGRSCKNIAASYYFGRDWYRSPIIIFDLSNFKEVAAPNNTISDEKLSGRNTTHTFSSHGRNVHEKWSEYFDDLDPGPEITKHPNFQKAIEERIVDENGLAKSNSEDGFRLNFRVAPRLFKGVALQGRENSEMYIDTVKKSYRDNPKSAIPIYNIGRKRKEKYYYTDDYDSIVGLIWPKKMSPEELAEYLKQKSQQVSD